MSDKKHNPLDILIRWKEAGISARRMPQLAFFYDGASVTRPMAQELKGDHLPIPRGITGFRLIATAVFYVPRLTPHLLVQLQRYGWRQHKKCKEWDPCTP